MYIPSIATVTPELKYIDKINYIYFSIIEVETEPKQGCYIIYIEANVL